MLTLPLEPFLQPFLFCFKLFSDRILIFHPGPALDCSLPTFLPGSWYYRHVSSHPATQLICWEKALLTFCLDWPQTMILQISASQVAGITGMSHLLGVIYILVSPFSYTNYHPIFTMGILLFFFSPY
jgi:hypothetical protein